MAAIKEKIDNMPEYDTIYENKENIMRTPVLYMMIGTPYSGKSTWIRNQIAKNGNYNYAIIDTDTWIEGRAKALGRTYGEVIKSEMPDAKRLMDHQLRNAIQGKYDIYWDQTNMTVKSRKEKLKKIPSFYDKVAVVFKSPDGEELERRIAMRKDKFIPSHVLQTMASSYQEPTHAEGFTQIIHVG
jgi:predicted kinase